MAKKTSPIPPSLSERSKIYDPKRAGNSFTGHKASAVRARKEFVYCLLQATAATLSMAMAATAEA
jgi:hypothetical protein